MTYHTRGNNPLPKPIWPNPCLSGLTLSIFILIFFCDIFNIFLIRIWNANIDVLLSFERDIIAYDSIRVPGLVLKCLNLITATVSVSHESGSVMWLATQAVKKIHALNWRNHIDTSPTLWPMNIWFWSQINIPSSYFNFLMLNFKLKFDSCQTWMLQDIPLWSILLHSNCWYRTGNRSEVQ